jgi:ribosomal protein L11 methyltransferase
MLSLSSPLIPLSPLVSVYPADAPIPSLRAGAIALAQVESKAFGDGSHPTTRLCAGAVDLLCRLERPEAVLDVGTGTGVLARVARARGAKRVVATDIDPEALRATRLNAGLDLKLGDAGRFSVEIEISDHMPDAWGPCFDLVVANILEGPLRELAPALARALRPGGGIFLSGFTAMQVPFLRERFEAQGLRLAGESSLDGWMLLRFRAEGS